MKITNDDIISAAKTLRSRQENGLPIPENPLKTPRSKTTWIAAAACAAGFLLGFGVHPSATPSPTADADGRQAEIDSLRQEVLMARSAEPEVIREVVHDTIFTTKVVTREVVRQVPVLANNEQPTENELNINNNNRGQSAVVGCSMMCDNISYDLIASKN